MKCRLFCFMIAMQLLICLSVAKRPFPSTNHAMSHPGTKEALASYQNKELQKGYNNKSEKVYEEDIGSRKIGSSPPNCEHKCYGCSPCEAIQVPSTSDHLGLQYANYEPESWKCKCGPSFYSP